MRVFLDFEATSLGKQGVPIEVAWIFENGAHESHLIRPAPDWSDWDDRAEAIHHIARATLIRDGEDHAWVAHRMADLLENHDLFASAPSWDGKWLSALLRPRHLLRLRDTDEALTETAREILKPHVEPDRLEATIARLAISAMPPAGPLAHRALPDAQAELGRWARMRDAALDFVRMTRGSA